MLKISDIKIGRDVFIAKRGVIGSVISYSALENLNKPATLLVWSNEKNMAFQCYTTDVEDIAQEVFKIGDRVESRLSNAAHSFSGIVTGFEEETNRVICRSARAFKQDRTRYAYKVYEIQKIQETVTFELNCRYKFNGEDVYRVVGHPTDRKSFILIEEKSGVAKMILSKEPITKSRLENAGVHNIQKMK